MKRKKTVLCIVSQYNFILSTWNMPSISVYLLQNGTIISDQSQILDFLRREAPHESVKEISGNSADYFSFDVLESDKKSSTKFMIIREEEIQSGIFNQKSSKRK